MTIDAKDFAAAMKKHLEERHAEIVRATYEVAHRGAAEAVRLTNEKGLVHLGTYKRGFVVVASRRNPKSTYAPPAELRNSTPYAAVIEWGRRPNRPGPPVEPIREWVRLKLGLTGDELERATFLIRRHIHIHGSKPHHIMHATYLKMQGWFKQEVERRLGT